ncbi:MAG: hypothetical protein QM323_03080 [Acidobacteriota bacterium]|nr:hypothetical protein [Acidobacteriota bacterium]
MGITKLHTLYGMDVGGTLIGGITEQRAPQGTTVQADPASGLPYPTAAFVTQHAPRPAGTTQQVLELLTAISAKGGDIETLGGVTLWYQAYDVSGLRAANGRSLAIAKGLIVPRTLTLSFRADATLSYEILIVGDEVSSPIAITDAAALPADITDDIRYGLGEIKVAGVTLTGVRQVTIDFGLDAKTEGADSDIVDSYACVETWKPEIRISGVNLDWVKDGGIPLLSYTEKVASVGKAATQANTTIQLRKKKPGGTWSASGHATIAMAGLAYVDDAGGASTGGYAEPSLVIAGIYDGTNDCITVS